MSLALIIDQGTVTFAVPLASGDYAPEKLTLRGRSGLAIPNVRGVIEAALPTGCVLEHWVLKTNGDPNVDADYMLYGNALSGASRGFSSFLWTVGAQIRAKSGGTNGSVTLHATAV